MADPSDKTKESLENSLRYQRERQKELAEQEERSIRNADTLIEKESKRIQNQLDILHSQEQEAKILKKLLDSNIQLSEEDQARLKHLTQENEQLEKILIKEEKRNAKTKDLSNSLSNSLGSLFGMNTQSNNLVTSMIQTAAAGGNVKLAIAETLSNFNLMNIAAGILSATFNTIVTQTKELALNQDKLFAKFEKEAGNVKIYQERIEALRNSQGKYLIGIKESTEAFMEFKKEFAGFEDLSQQNTVTLATTAAKLQQLGMSMKDLIANQDIMIKSMGMSVVQSDELQMSLYATSQKMGLPIDKLTKDFAKASSTLVARGSEMKKVFIDLEKSSKETGIQFDKLVTLASKFNTFDSAASSAGNLNAILQGDYFNSLELINTTESERIRIIQERLRLNGMDIRDMDQSIQLAIAQELGYSDLNDLHKIMNNEISKGSYESIKAAEAQEIMNEAIKNATELTQQWNYMLSNLAIGMRPVIDKVKDIITWFNEMDKQTWSWIAGITALVGSLGAVFVLVQGVSTFIAFGKAIKGLGAVSELAAGQLGKVPAVITKTTSSAMDAASGTNQMSQGMTNAGRAAATSWQSILAFGGAVLLIGGGIYLASKGLAELVKAFDNTVQAGYALGAIGIVLLGFAVILKILSGSLIAFSIAGTEAALPLLALGGAMALIGVGIGVAAYGLSYLVKSFEGLGENATAAAWGIGVFTVAFLALVGAIALMITGPQAAIAAGAIGFLWSLAGVAAVIGLSVAVAGAAIGYMASSIGAMFTAIDKADPENITKVMSALWDSLSGWGVVKFASFASDAEQFVKAIDPMTASAIKLTNALKELKSIRSETNGIPSAPVVPSTGDSTATSSSTRGNTLLANSSAQAPLNITLQIDGNTLAGLMAGTVQFQNGVLSVIKDKVTK